MVSTDFYKGDGSILYIDFNGSFAPMACLTTHSVSEVTDSLETSVSTAENGNWRTFTPDFQSYSLQASGLMINDQAGEFANRLSLPKMKTLKRSGTVFKWEILTNNGEFVEAGNGFITSLTENASVGDFITFEVSIQGVGQLLSAGDMKNTSWDSTEITFDSTETTFDEI